VRLEEKVNDISHNMSLLMVDLARNIGPFGEVRGSNSKIRSNRKSRDNEDLKNEPWKGLRKEKSISTSIKPSYSLFNMESKVDINPYQDEIDELKLNHWL
jgi:hypothetical protein